ncbi:MAG TPA: serine hydrolase [Patescibacteria group bacterium]|nr:serine hydrolase [Patescibacteria group bacterium]
MKKKENSHWFKKTKTFLSREDFYIRLLLIPLVLLAVCTIFVLLNLRVRLLANEQQLSPLFLSYTMHEYPTLGTFSSPYISAQSAAIYEPDSAVFLYTKNSSLHFSLASTTKLMTALVALDYFKLNSVLTVQRDSVEGTVLNLYSGEKFTFSDLLYAMLLNSANDAAYAIADNYPGGTNAFVSAMNTKAHQLHLLNTHFKDPAGLEDDGDFTTVTELARLAGTALQSPVIAQVIDTKTKLISTTDGLISYPLENLNQLLGLDGVIGMKTGTTEGAGQVLITAKKENNHVFIIVVMESTDRYADTWALLQLIDSKSQFIDPLALLKQ